MIFDLALLKKKDDALLPLIGESEKEGVHLELLFKIAHLPFFSGGTNKEPLNEMAAYRYLLAHLDAPFSLDFVLGLYGALSDQKTGKWKTSNNYLESNGSFFICESFEKTPATMKALCERFAYLSEPKESQIDDIFLFILHFICVHPFQNGNGRTSAFLYQFLLYKAGLKAVIYLPIDAFMNRIHGKRTSIEIRRACGNFYGKKPIDPSLYIPYIQDILTQCYDCLFDALTQK